MIYFVSGHRNITVEEFKKYYVSFIETVLRCDRNCHFVVGDYQGVDLMAQKLLVNFPTKVTVYHMFDTPRNLASTKFLTRGGYTSDEERDAAMTMESDFDIAWVRPGRRDSGTAQNIIRRKEIIV